MSARAGSAAPSPAPPTNARSSPPSAFRFRAWIPPAIYLALAAAFLWRSTFTSAVFLPADLLKYAAPWNDPHAASLPAWNPLRWDGIAQFYPWRLFASQTVHSGELPLWNPYQFCGTPFAANSQSAPFYPGNLLFYLLPTARAFGFSALLHLAACGWFTYLFLRRIRCSEWASLLGGIVFAYSAWQVAWLQLPTFLATSCWIPFVLLQSHAVISNHGRFSVAALGIGIGMMLLAGHLQIAFYGLLAAAIWCCALLCSRWRANGTMYSLGRLGSLIAGSALGLAVCMPQLLPSLELSRMSHRVGAPTSAGYELYTAYALPPGGLAQLALPDFFGGDSDPSNPYWGYYIIHPGGYTQAVRHNAAETAIYVGITPLILGIAALFCGIRPALDKRSLFFGGLAVLALLMALGTPVDMLFYFHVPGFSQSGSPARSLVLWAFALSALAAIGFDRLVWGVPVRQLLGIAAVCAISIAIGLSLAVNSMSAKIPGFDQLAVPTVGDALSRMGEDAIRLALFFICGLALFSPQLRALLQHRSQSRFELAIGAAACLIVAADLFAAGIRANPVAETAAVYPVTPGIRYLMANTGHDRIYPVNMYWSLYHGPHAVLPPNAATVFGLRDVQGYDSLLTGAYKRWADQFALPDTRPASLNRRDSSPVEVANMIFFQDPNLPAVANTSARFTITRPATETAIPGATPAEPRVDAGDDDMDVYDVPQSRSRAWLEGARGTVSWLEDGPMRVRIAVDSDGPAVLNLNDQYYPGWHVKIDGVPADVIRQSVTPVLRAVRTPAGRHVVEFDYEPASFRIGLYFALIAWAAVIAWAALCYGFRSNSPMLALTPS